MVRKGEDGQYFNLHTDGPMRPACMSSDWADYIRDILLVLVKEHGLTYMKPDLAIVTVPWLDVKKNM